MGAPASWNHGRVQFPWPRAQTHGRDTCMKSRARIVRAIRHGCPRDSAFRRCNKRLLFSRGRDWCQFCALHFSRTLPLLPTLGGASVPCPGQRREPPPRPGSFRRPQHYASSNVAVLVHALCGPEFSIRNIVEVIPRFLFYSSFEKNDNFLLRPAFGIYPLHCVGMVILISEKLSASASHVLWHVATFPEKSAVAGSGVVLIFHCVHTAIFDP